MKEIIKWYCSEMDQAQLSKVFGSLPIKVPGFTKGVRKIPLPLMRRYFTEICTNSDQDKLMFYLFIVNEELHDEIIELEWDEIQAREQELIHKYNIQDYILGLLAMLGPDQWSDKKEYIQNLIKKAVEHKDAAAKRDLREQALENDMEPETKKQIKVLNKKIKDKNDEVIKLNNEIVKLKNFQSNAEEKYKKQIGDLDRAHQKLIQEFNQLKADHDNLQWQRDILEQKVQKKDTDLEAAQAEHKRLNDLVNEYETNIKVWQAKYPHEKINNKTIRVIILGDRPQHKIDIMAGVVVDKTIVSFDEAELFCSQIENIKKYDLGFLIPNRCSAELRRKILSQFSRCQVKINDIPNIKGSEAMILEAINKLNNKKRPVT